MSGALNKTVTLKETHAGRRRLARALLTLAAALRKAARRLDAAGVAEAGLAAAGVAPEPVLSGQPRRARSTADPVFWGLVRKDLYASRLIIVAAFVTAALGVGIQKAGGEVAAYILLYCAGAAPAAFLCLMLISGERQERSHLFALSLPISPARYLLAKLVAVTTAFAIPWVLLLGAALGLLLMTPLGAGIVPYVIVVWLFVLDLFCGLLAVVAASRSAGLVTTAMILFNVSPSLFFNYVARWTDPQSRTVMAWNAYALWAVAIELTIAVACFVLTLWCVRRQKDET